MKLYLSFHRSLKSETNIVYIYIYIIYILLVVLGETLEFVALLLPTR
nr:MAG TPA: hypothetical protein [Crassvirales sp.]